MRGPRERVSDVSPPSEFGRGSAGALDSAAGIESVPAVPPFVDTGVGGRFRDGRLRGRMFSPSTW